ncbi:RNA polymerase sigma factor rpoD [Vibrio sp. JCM 19236]|nr:RNA polymerase sigma factor rpoD [Vibrio sp. JCM 19236]
MDQNRQSQLKALVLKGKEQGYLTYAEVNDHLPPEIVDSEQVEDIIQMINDMGIKVVENATEIDDDTIDETTTEVDEEAAEAAVAALSSVESEIGRTTDPVRMYMREMVPLSFLLVKARSTLLNALKTVSTKYRLLLQNFLALSHISLSSSTRFKLKSYV